MKGKFIPYIIIGTFVGFALFVGSFIYRATQTDLNLVSKDYYKKEIEYQSHIDKLKRSSKYENQISVKAVNGQMDLHFPEELIGFKGKIQLFRPSNSKLDQSMEMRLDAKKISIDVSELIAGAWEVKMDLSKGDETFYFERSIEL